MLIGIDHVIFAVPDLDGAARDVEQALGLPVGEGGRHDAHGTHNRLAWLGDSYIELMAVFDETLARDSWWGRHALGVVEGGGGYMGVVLASDGVDTEAVACGPAEQGRRVRDDGREVRWWIRRPVSADPDLGLAFLIEHDTGAAEWTAKERADRAAQSRVRLARLEVPVGDMQAATIRIHRELGVAFRPSLAGGGARDGAIGRQTLRLLRDRRRRMVLTGGDRQATAALLGCDWSLEPGEGA